MFTRWGDLVVKLRFVVLAIVSAALLALGGYGLGLGDHLSSSGFDDPTSESAEAARISDSSFGRDHNSDVLVLYTAPEGKTIDDPEFRDKIVDSLNRLPREHPDQIAKVNGAYWQTETGAASPLTFGSKDKKHTFASIAIVGDNDTEMVRNYREVKDAFTIDGVDVQVAGLQPVAGTLNDTMADDQKRMEVLAIPVVGVLLFFIFGGLVAAALPLVVGGLTVIGAWGIVRFLTHFTEVNSFVSPVVSMIGLGLAIDYGLFIVSRFREELAEGYDTRAAVRRSVMTAGRTVVFSATMIIASLGGMLLFPQGFLKSVAYGAIATVTLAAITAITVLPALLAILGRRVDMFGIKKFKATKTAEEVENSLWGRSTRWVMQHPLKIAIPITIILLLLILPVRNLAFGGINERYLPPDNPTRVAQAEFDEIFPLRKSDPVQLVFVSEDTTAIGAVLKQVNQAPGLAGNFEIPTKSPTRPDVFRTNATLADSENADPTIEYLRSIDVPDSVTMLVGGQPAIQKDSIDALLERMPLMIALVLFVTTLLMFLTFGSLVLPIKAALMSALGLGSTLGILTWIFVDGHGAELLNFTPQPITSPVLVLIIAIIYGLSIDYEVFLLSRMVEARSRGASTTEAVRVGTAHTGRIITAAALILLVVTGAFAFSDLVMMKYIAYGMVAALFIDATILRMLLVPATMKLLGDDCWWAPAWMKRVQEKIGLGEPILDDERPGGGEVVDLVKTTPITDPVTMQMPAVTSSKLRKSPRRPRTVEEIEAEAPTARIGATPEGGPRRRAVAPSKAARPAEPRPQVVPPGPHDPSRPQPQPHPAGRGRVLPPPRTVNEATQPHSPADDSGEQGGDAPGTPIPSVDVPRRPEGPGGLPRRSEGAGEDVPRGHAPEPDASRAPGIGTPQDGRTPGAGRVPGISTPHATGGTPDAGRAPGTGAPYTAGATQDPGRAPGIDTPYTAGGTPDPSRAPGTGTPYTTGGTPDAGRAAGLGMGMPYPGGGTPDPDAGRTPGAPYTGTGTPVGRAPGNAPAGPGGPPQSRHAAPGADQPPAVDLPRRPADQPAADQPGGEPRGPSGLPQRRPGSSIAAGTFGPSPLSSALPGDNRPSGAGATQLGGTRPSEPADTPRNAPPPGTDDRNSVEDWMAELRSSRRRISSDDTRPGDDGRTVSVNELLRRREGE